MRGRRWVPSPCSARPLQHRGHFHDRFGHLGPGAPREACHRRSGRAGSSDLPAPDSLAYLDRPTWRTEIAELADLSGIDTATYDGFLDALRSRRAAFVEAGVRATDHGHLLADSTPMEKNAARELYARVLGGAEPSQSDVDAFAANMLSQMAEMSCEDGLVMQIHPGVLRNHNTAIGKSYGPDKGYDIPIQTEFTRALRPMLDRFGTDPQFRVILFTVDETVYSRELAPLAGTYPSVRLGAPWWFLDSPEGMRRFRESATETAGFYNTSGFVDDTRAYASIPARHDLFRRVDAGYLARLVLEHRLSLAEAVETAIDLTYNLPKESYPQPGR
jgi:glucuronate isomerase